MENYIVEYEASFGISAQSIAMYFLAITSIVVYFLLWKKMKISAKAFFMVVNIILVIICTSITVTSIDAIQMVEDYKKGNFEVIEGVITDYNTNEFLDPPLYIDEFYVEEEYFGISRNNPFGLGYNVRKCDGGKLDDGIHVRICYIERESMNIIMKLEVLE